jgi:Flp pilus assembly protein CpaB
MVTLRTYLVVALALVLGISAAIGVSALVKQINAQATEKVSIVVAKTDLIRFVPITEAQVELKEVPKDMVPPGALTRIEDVLDRAALGNLSKHDYILEQMLAKKWTKTVASAIPPGKCAFLVKDSNVSNFVQPGDRVDVILTLKQKSGTVRSVTILSMIDVMAVNGSLIPMLDARTDGKEPQSVNLLLTQEQARELEEGQKQGTIRLTLRNVGDTRPVAVTKLADLKLDPPDAKDPALPQPQLQETVTQPTPPVQIRTIRGSHEGIVLVQPTEKGAARPKD